MYNEVMMGCPQCCMAYSMSSPLVKKEGEYCCSANPEHRYVMDSQGMLKSK